MFVLESKVYIFRVDKYWVFEYKKQNNEQPLGLLIEGNLEISSKWQGIDVIDNRFTVHNNKIVSISGNKWTELKPNGEVDKAYEITIENLIEEDQDQNVNFFYQLEYLKLF